MAKNKKESKNLNENLIKKLKKIKDDHTLQSKKSYELYETQFQEDVVHQLWHLVEDLRQVHVKIDKQHHLLKDIQLIGDCINDKLFRYGILTKQEDE